MKALDRLVEYAALVLCLCALVAGAQANPMPEARETVLWQRAPIHVALKVGEQRRVTFPTPVLFGHVRALDGALEVQNVEDTLYLTAANAFTPTQILVRECIAQADICTPAGRVYLLALSAGDDTPAQRPLFVTLPSAGGGAPDALETQTERVYSPVELVRHGAQQLYAPSRLLRSLEGVSRVPLRTDAPVALYAGGALKATPKIAWTDGRLQVTAVELVNITPVAQLVDVRALRGAWLSRTMLAGHARLQPAGHRHDRTTVFLVSPGPFEEAITWLR